MAGISTHVLDTSRGRPAAGVPVTLEYRAGDGWEQRGGGFTDDDGRIEAVHREGGGLDAGAYRLTFDTGAYHRGHGIAAFHPRVVVEFEVREGSEHHHVPLLLSPFAYTTYRGS